MKKIISPILAFMLVFPLLSIALLPKINAAVDTCTWTGANSGDWSDGGNWTGCDNGGVPEDGDSLVFPLGAANLTNTNDIAGLDAAAITVNDAYTLDLGTMTLGAGGLNVTVSGTDFSGTVTLSASSTFTFTNAGLVPFNVTTNLNGFDLTVDATLSVINYVGAINGTGNVIKNGPGTLRPMATTSTYTGSTTVNAGYLEAFGTDAIPDTSCVIVNSTATFALLDDETIGCLSGAGTVYLDIYTLTLDQSTNSTFTGIFDGTTGAVTKDGSGTFTYSGGYSPIIGDTNVNDGVFQLTAGSMPGSTFFVDAGAELDIANGAYVGAINIDGVLGVGTVGVGDANSGSVVMSAGSTFEAYINGSTASSFSRLYVTGTTVNLGSSTFSLSGSYLPLLGESFIIIDNDGADAVVGTFAGLPEGSTIAFNGGVFTISYVGGTGNDVVLTVTTAAAFYPTTTALVSSINPTLVGECTNLTATVSDSSPLTATGTVSFYDGATLLGSVAINGSGVAILSVCNLTAGSHNITAVYSGDAGHATSTSSILVQVVNAPLSDTGAIIPSQIIAILLLGSLTTLISINQSSNIRKLALNLRRINKSIL